jgi:hypothetical protein
MFYSITFLALSTALALQPAGPLAVQAYATPALVGAPAYASALPDAGSNDAPPDAGHGKECYAKVKFGAQYGAAPPTGPHYVWRQEPGPPGAPGPIWCLVPAEVRAPQPVLISPERYGWIRVLCDTEATPARIVGVQRQLSAAGVYQGPVDGRYDSNTTAAVERFQAQRHIEDRGYLSYATLSALSVYSQSSYQQSYAQSGYVQNGYAQSGYAPNGYPQAPNPYPYPYPQGAPYPQAQPRAYSYRPLTTFDTGVITWPGKR